MTSSVGGAESGMVTSGFWLLAMARTFAGPDEHLAHHPWSSCSRMWQWNMYGWVGIGVVLEAHQQPVVRAAGRAGRCPSSRPAAAAGLRRRCRSPGSARRGGGRRATRWLRSPSTPRRADGRDGVDAPMVVVAAVDGRAGEAERPRPAPAGARPGLRRHQLGRATGPTSRRAGAARRRRMSIVSSAPLLRSSMSAAARDRRGSCAARRRRPAASRPPPRPARPGARSTRSASHGGRQQARVGADDLEAPAVGEAEVVDAGVGGVEHPQAHPRGGGLEHGSPGAVHQDLVAHRARCR